MAFMNVGKAKPTNRSTHRKDPTVISITSNNCLLRTIAAISVQLQLILQPTSRHKNVLCGRFSWRHNKAIFVSSTHQFHAAAIKTDSAVSFLLHNSCRFLL